MTIFHLLVALAILILIPWSIAMSTALARLQASVTNLTNISAGIITMVTGLAQQIRDADGDTDQLNALADQLDTDAANMAKAITDNTPVVTAPGVQPDPTVPPLPAVPASGDSDGAALPGSGDAAGDATENDAPS
jgi:TolA-binding protein